jgi:hypothetical protein
LRPHVCLLTRMRTNRLPGPVMASPRDWKRKERTGLSAWFEFSGPSWILQAGLNVVALLVFLESGSVWPYP